MLKTPDRAIAAFEYFTRTKVVFYIQDPLLNQAVTHRIHDTRECFAAKKDSVGKCYHFDCVDFISERWNYRNGGLKICRAGILEWIMPVMDENRNLLGILNAGIRKAPAKIPEDMPVYGFSNGVFPGGNRNLPEPGETELRMVMELLRQLAARLLQWRKEMRDIPFTDQDLSRADRIRCLLQQYPGTGVKCLKQLAERLHLSPGRTAHAVKEETGLSFKELQLSIRLNYARSLLRTTGLPVGEVASNCGFFSLPNFHRLFRRRFGKTPLEYRKNFYREISPP